MASPFQFSPYAQISDFRSTAHCRSALFPSPRTPPLHDRHATTQTAYHTTGGGAYRQRCRGETCKQNEQAPGGGMQGRGARDGRV